MVDADGQVTGRHGALVDWVETGRHCSDALPFLRGQEQELQALARGERQPLRLTGTHRGDDDGRPSSYSVHGFRLSDPPGVVLVLQESATIDEPVPGIMGRDDDPSHAERPADVADDAKSVLLATISHELRTPLNVIIGNAEILRDWDSAKLTDDELRAFADDVLENGNDLLDHINDLLELAKSDFGGINLIEERLDIGAEIDQALAVNDRLADARSLTLEHRPQPGLPTLVADARHVRQIIDNLLCHAMLFTPDGGTVSVRSSLDGDGALTIDVIDGGLGLAADGLERASQPLGHSIAPAENRGHCDAVAGLPLARLLVELNAGTLTQTSAPGQGTRVTVRFPADRVLVDR